MTKRNGNIDPKTNGAEDYLSRVPENFDAIERSGLVDTWNLSGSALIPESVDDVLKSSVKSRVFDAIEVDSIETDSPGTDRAIVHRLISGLRLVDVRLSAVAATVLLLIGMSFILAPEIHVIEAPRGSVDATGFTLPDGTSGFISAGSELRYSDTFSNRSRTVALKGEALFNVVKDGSRFNVNTYNTRVVVLGTSFSVRAWTSDIEPETLVKVREGKVGVSRRYISSLRVDLEPGEQINVHPQVGVVTERITPISDHSFNWLGGGVDFIDMPVGSVMNELERRFDVRLNAHVSVRNRRITLLPSDRASLEDVLVDMSAALNIRYRKIAGGYEFYLDSVSDS